jgi:hypothetical protein
MGKWSSFETRETSLWSRQFNWRVVLELFAEPHPDLPKYLLYLGFIYIYVEIHTSSVMTFLSRLYISNSPTDPYRQAIVKLCGQPPLSSSGQFGHHCTIAQA